jgi:hypothetical protein
LKSVQTIIGEILVVAQKISKAIESKEVMLRVHPDVAKVLKAKDNQYLEELEEILARPVIKAPIADDLTDRLIKQFNLENVTVPQPVPAATGSATTPPPATSGSTSPMPK